MPFAQVGFDQSHLVGDILCLCPNGGTFECRGGDIGRQHAPAIRGEPDSLGAVTAPGFQGRPRCQMGGFRDHVWMWDTEGFAVAVVVRGFLPTAFPIVLIECVCHAVILSLASRDSTDTSILTVSSIWQFYFPYGKMGVWTK